MQGWDETMYENLGVHPSCEVLLQMAGNMFNGFAIASLTTALFLVVGDIFDPPDGPGDPEEVVEVQDSLEASSESDWADWD